MEGGKGGGRGNMTQSVPLHRAAIEELINAPQATRTPALGRLDAPNTRAGHAPSARVRNEARPRLAGETVAGVGLCVNHRHSGLSKCV